MSRLRSETKTCPHKDQTRDHTQTHAREADTTEAVSFPLPSSEDVTVLLLLCHLTLIFICLIRPVTATCCYYQIRFTGALGRERETRRRVRLYRRLQEQYLTPTNGAYCLYTTNGSASVHTVCSLLCFCEKLTV